MDETWKSCCCPFCLELFLFVALFVECCLPMRLVSSVCSASSTVRDYFHTGCVSFLALFLCISVFLFVYISRHDWFHQQVVQPQFDRLETIQLLEYQSQLHRCSCLYKSNGNLDLGLMPLVITMSRGAILSAVFPPPAHLCSSWFDCCRFVVFYHKTQQGNLLPLLFGDDDGNDDERDDEAPIVVSKVFSVEKGSALMDPLRHWGPFTFLSFIHILRLLHHH